VERWSGGAVEFRVTEIFKSLIKTKPKLRQK
jgi:hypothetical protein